MTPLADLAADWQEISRLLDDALARPVAERDAWLASQSDLPVSVRQVVQDMLNELVETKSRLDQVLE